MTLTLNNTSLSSVTFIVPPFFKQINYCCIDPSCSQLNISTCTFTTTQNTTTITLILKSTLNISNVLISLKNIDYQAIFLNTTLNVATGFPSASRTIVTDVIVSALKINSTLSVGSYKVNEASSYNLVVRPISQTGYLGIQLPQFIINQLSSPSVSYSIAINNVRLTNPVLTLTDQQHYQLNLNNTIQNISFNISSFINPSNNEPFSLTILQSTDSSFTRVYGSTIFPVSMTIFDLIEVSILNRNVTKINQPTTVTMNITSPNYTDTMIISLPPYEMFTSPSCSVQTNSLVIPCTVINSTSISF